MQERKPYLAFTAPPDIQKELENLYARRAALIALLQALEEYRRFRGMALPQVPSKRKTA
jgi:hypothetical protein